MNLHYTASFAYSLRSVLDFSNGGTAMTKTQQGAIPLEELASLPRFFMPNVSYYKNYIAFYWDKSGRMELYVMEAKPGAEPRKVSDGTMPLALHAGFCWSRDSKHIIYAKDDNGDEQHNLWRINVETGEAEQLTNNPK